MGGIGKTEIALAIAVQQRGRWHIFWIDCRSEIEMINNYKSIWSHLAQSSSDPSTTAVKAMLSGRNDWLLIFDNVDEDSTLSIIREQLLPPGEFGQVLFTGRLSSLRTRGYAVEIPLLDIQESQLLLKKCCPSFRLLEDDGGALTLLLGQLPLAIEQAGMYMEVNSIQISEYLEEISEPLASKASLLGEGPASPYSRPLLRTWEMAFARISEDAKIVLNILGFLRPDGVDESFFKSSTDHKAHAPWSMTNSLQDFDRGVRLPDSYAHSLASPAIFRAAVNSLLRLSLIKRSETKKLSMHPVCLYQQSGVANPLTFIQLVRLWVAERLEPETRQQLAKVTLTLTANYLSHKTDMDFVRNGDFVQYAVTCMSNMSPYNAWTGADKELEAKAYFYLGRAYWAMGALNEAQVLFKKSKASSEVLFGPNHPWTLWSCNNLAIILTEQNKYDEACEYAQLAVNGMTTTFGAEHDETLIAKANLSTAKEHRTTEVPMNLLMAPPETLFPYTVVPANPSDERKKKFAVTSKERLTNDTRLEFLREHRYDGDQRELPRRLDRLLGTFEDSEGHSYPDYTKFSSIRIHFFATIYVFLGKFKKADGVYEKTLRTVSKALPPSQRKIAERILQLNSRILKIIDPGHKFNGRDRHGWLSDANRNIEDLRNLYEKESGQSVHRLCRGVATLLPDLSACELVDCIDNYTLSVESDQHRAVKTPSKLANNCFCRIFLFHADQNPSDQP